ncbi:dihydrolipoamide acyltransferase [Sphingopyxis sp. OPL5]|jgi:pyruvate/2-oxoglutarate dehydrogenase complex dihydrolipoamide acyltransferase (E2) component|uniref:biotin/lipoyl-containing protein n=1 Tax=Sphingopyxis sp. OPL5 TaxID=2486273 RepID=UPI00164D0FE6|nr:lipoyl domain-containing protein [Sphingopyxis sp. OPL5]QNO25646.1 dihydrolipoamide acyltransferase [Sphingopyxis sp. OPL5]
MKTEICIPGLGAGMSEGTLVEWHVDDSADIVEGAILYTLESEKTAQDVEAPVSGKVRRIGVVGEVYPVGEVVAIIEH